MASDQGLFTHAQIPEPSLTSFLGTFWSLKSHFPFLSPLSLGLAPHPPALPSPFPTYYQEYRLGIGITFIDMSVGNVKEAADRRSFDLTTPYRIFR